MRRPLMMLAVGGLASALLVIGGGTLWYERPTRLSVAVSSADPDDLALMVAALTQLKHSRRTIRLHIVQVENSVAAAAAVDADAADLAVVRTDLAMPNNGKTVIILHRDAAILVAPSSGNIHDIDDLAGRKVGIVNSGPANQRLLETALAQYDIRPEAVEVVSLQPPEVAEAIRGKRVDAVLAVDVVSSPLMHEMVRAVAAAGGGPPVFVPVAEADAIAQRSPAYDSLEIVRGAFGGSPPRPADEFDTISVTHRLVADKSVAEGAISELTRFFLSERLALASAAPLARHIEAPSTDKGSALPVHDGTAAYIDDEEETFFDKYSDFIYIGAMLLGVLASAATAVMSRMNSHKAALLDSAVRRLIEMLGLARGAPNASALDALQAEADECLAAALNSAAAASDDGRLKAFGLALDQVRAAIRDRRRALGSAAHHEGFARAAAE